MGSNRIALLVGFVFLFTNLAACREQDSPGAGGADEKATVAIYNFPGSAPIHVAYDKGYFEDEGLDVTLVPYAGANAALQDALARRADFATSADTPIARAVLAGRPVAVIATISQIQRGVLIIARRDRGISSPQDLRGKTVGMVAGTTTEFFLRIYLSTFQIAEEDVHIVNLAPDKFNDALLNGEVDAVSANAPYNMVLRDKLGSNALVLDDPGIYTMTWNVSVAQDFARENPDCITKFLRAILRANDFIRQNSEAARAISEQYFDAKSPLYQKEWPDYRFTAALDQSLVLNLEEQARWMINSGGGAQTMPNFLDYIYADGLREVRPQAVQIAGK